MEQWFQFNLCTQDTLLHVWLPRATSRDVSKTGLGLHTTPISKKSCHRKSPLEKSRKDQREGCGLCQGHCPSLSGMSCIGSISQSPLFPTFSSRRHLLHRPRLLPLLDFLHQAGITLVWKHLLSASASPSDLHVHSLFSYPFL